MLPVDRIHRASPSSRQSRKRGGRFSSTRTISTAAASMRRGAEQTLLKSINPVFIARGLAQEPGGNQINRVSPARTAPASTGDGVEIRGLCRKPGIDYSRMLRCSLLRSELRHLKSANESSSVRAHQPRRARGSGTGPRLTRPLQSTRLETMPRPDEENRCRVDSVQHNQNREPGSPRWEGKLAQLGTNWPIGD